MHISDSIVNSDIVESERNKRLRCTDDWLQGAEFISNTVDDDKTKELVRGILADVSIYKPTADYLPLIVQGSNNSRSLRFIPLYASDYGVSAKCTDMLSDEVPYIRYYGGFEPGLYINDEVNVSVKWKGLLLLHEALHAQNDLDMRRKKLSPRGRGLEELEAFQYTHNLLRKLLPSTYAEMVDDLADYYEIEPTIGQFWRNTDTAIIFQLLDQVFMRPYSEAEKLSRLGVVWLDVVLRALEKLHGVNAASVKEAWLADYYAA